MARVYVSAPVNPTEERERVLKAILNVFPDFEESGGEGYVSGTSADVSRFKQLLEGQRIRSAARGAMYSGKMADGLHFSLNKQAAYVSVINFGLPGQALGTIDVHIESDDPMALLDSIAPAPPPRPAGKARGRGVHTTEDAVEDDGEDDPGGEDL